MEVMPGYKQTDVGTIPIDWDVKPLGEIGKSLIGLTYRPSEVRKTGTLVLRSSNVQRGTLCFDDNVFVESDIPERIMVRPGDILVCVRNGSRDLIGKSALIDERAVGMTFGAFMGVFRSEYGQFLSHVFQSGIFKKQISEHLGATINQITNKSLNSFKVSLPPRGVERTKISSALSGLDALLDSLDRLIAKKRDLKQAAMQQLLTGQTRLPGFSGEWEVKRLGDVVEIRKGQLITSSTLQQGDIPVVAGGKQPAYFHSSANRVGRTVTISASGASAGYVALYNEPIFASDCSTIGESDDYCLDFVFFQLLNAQQTIYKAQTGGAQPHIHAKDLNPILFVFPPKSEQTAIANVLTKMDAELSVVEMRRNKTAALKQGMMQELLTGRTRLV